MTLTRSPDEEIIQSNFTFPRHNFKIKNRCSGSIDFAKHDVHTDQDQDQENLSRRGDNGIHLYMGLAHGVLQTLRHEPRCLG